uniref:uncharacterized protein LOC122610402 n=1 Tax=Erigeron canadensis TaxID=72917 RepID=UPI001CB9149A|nr:uncharacterized protein LOC122610402 [Erigeron canadensis]
MDLGKKQKWGFRSERGEEISARIPMPIALRVRNCSVDSNGCVMCNEGDETVEHLICSCATAVGVWHRQSVWCKIPPISIKDITEVEKFVGLGRTARKVFKKVLFVSCWCIWKARNPMVFDNERSDPDKIFQEIQSIGFLWYKNRSKN